MFVPYCKNSIGRTAPGKDWRYGGEYGKFFEINILPQGHRVDVEKKSFLQKVHLTCCRIRDDWKPGFTYGAQRPYSAVQAGAARPVSR
jgi:hypothetical protein